MVGGIRRWFEEWKPSAVTLGLPTFPLLVLFGLNAVDELDRAAFAVLLPDIRDHFQLTTAEGLTIVSITTIAVLLIEIPLSFYVDRGNRVRIAAVGAAVWGLFSLGTAAAASVALLILMRIGAGTGRAVVTPTHSSLLSDYYPVEARVKTFSFHRQANSVGLILGPAIGGILGEAFGWRLPFVVFAFPTFIFVVLALRLQEPVRGMQERIAAGYSDADNAATEQKAPSFTETVRMLYAVRTIRRIWLAVPFLSVALLGIGSLLAIVYKDVFGLNAAERGLVAAVIEPMQIVGVFVAIPWVAKKTLNDPGFLLRFVAYVGVFVGTAVAALAFAPNVWIAIVLNGVVSGTIGTLAPAFFAMISIVAPPRARAVSFSTISIFGIPGFAIFLPLIGKLADEWGVDKAMLLMVPATLAAGFILASAARFVEADIARAQAQALEAMQPPPSATEPVV